MGKRSGPRRGSLAFYPRKRSRRIWPSVTHFDTAEKPGIRGFACYKAGMTRVIASDGYEKSPSYGLQISTPVTVLECPPLFVFGVRAYAKTPYGMKTVSEVFAEKPDKDLSRVICLPKKSSREEKVKRINAALGSIAEFRLLVHTQPRKIRFKKTPELLEFTVSGKPEEAWKWALDILGKEIAFKSVFAENDWVDAIAITTGKGTQGPVARFGIKIQGRKAHGHRRFPGCIGGWHPAKTLWTVPQMGQVGFQRRTDLNKRLLKIGEDGKEVTPDGGFVNYGQAVGSYALVQGSVPGPRNRLVVLRHALRQNRKLPALAIVETIRSTQQ